MDSTRPLKMCSGIWQNTYFKSYKLWGEASVFPFICLAHPTDGQLNWKLENLEAKLTPQTCCCDPQTIPEPFLLCGRDHYPAESSHQRILYKWKDVTIPRHVVHVEVTSTWMVGPKVSQEHITQCITPSPSACLITIMHGCDAHAPGHPHYVK